jgi:integral membrane protein
MLRIFKNVAILEGISFLVLIANMFINKANNPELYHIILKPLGWAHGALFIGYVTLAVLITKSQKWNYGTLSIVLIASLLPFATFYIERKYIQIPECK